MKNAATLIGSALFAVAATGMATACGQEPPACGGTEDYSNHSAPKVIQSKDINSFSYTFLNEGRVATVRSRGGHFIRVDDDGSFHGRCELRLVRNGEKADFSVSDSGNWQAPPFKTSGTVGKEALAELQTIIDKYDVARLNGFYKRNSARGNYFNLRINYDSGESITAGGEGGFSVVPDGGLPDGAFSAFFQKLLQQSGQTVPSGLPPANTITHFELSFFNNHPEKGFPAGRYLMQYFHIEGRKGREYAYASFEPADATQKIVFKTDFKKQEVKALQSLIDRENLTALSGYTNRKPELGDQKFHMEIAFQDRRLLRADAIGDESVLPAKYWTDGRHFVEFFQQAAVKRGKAFP